MKGDIAEIILYDAALSEADRATLHTYLAQRYAIGVPTTPALSIVPAPNGSVTISWPANVTGWNLESAPNLAAGWSAVSGVVDNRVTQTVGTTQYYRLRSQ